MAFGRRGPDKQKAQATAVGSIGRGNVKTVTEPGDAAIDTMKRVVITVAGLVSCFIVYMLLPTSQSAEAPRLRQALNAHVIPNAPLLTGKLHELTDQNFDRIAFDFSAPDRNRQNELVLSPVGRKVRDACLPRSRRATAPATPATTASGDDWTETVQHATTDIYPWALRMDYARATEFLQCALVAEPQRFCDPHNRRQLAEHLALYVQLHDLIAKRAERSTSPDGAPVVPASTGTAAPKDAALTKPLDRGIANGIAEAARFGYLAPQDFALVQYVPSAVRQVMEPQKEVRCTPPDPNAKKAEPAKK